MERNEGGGNIYPRRRRGARAGTVTKALFSRTGPGLFSSLRSNSIGDMGKYLRSAASYNIRPIRFTSSRVIPVLHDNQSSEKFGIGGRQVVHRGMTRTAIAGKEENNRDHEKLGVAAALFATYFSVMFAKCALPSTLPLLLSASSGFDFEAAGDAQFLMSRVLSISTVFLAIGKVVLGPVIDSFTGVPSLKAALFTLAVCLCTISKATTFRMFAVAWVVIGFVFSACWAACLNAVHGYFEQSEWPSIVSLLAIAARTGNAVAFAFFGLVLSIFGRSRADAWRLVFGGELDSHCLTSRIIRI